MTKWSPEPDEAFKKLQRNKAKELRKSAWWKSQLAEGRCHYCKQSFSPAELSMDHVIPVARGGESKKSNLVPACKACNTEKKLKTPAEMIMDSWNEDNNS